MWRICARRTRCSRCQLSRTRRGSLSELASARTDVAVIPFARSEELARKFHLSASAPLIRADIADIAAVEQSQSTIDAAGGSDQPSTAAELGADITDLAHQIRTTPDRFRFRPEHNFGFLFHTGTHDVHILSDSECVTLATELDRVAK